MAGGVFVSRSSFHATNHMKLYEPDENYKRGQKCCAICGKVDDKDKMSFTQHKKSKVVLGNKIPNWLCGKHAKELAL